MPTKLCWTFLWITFSRIWMCLRPFVVVLRDQRTQVVLSLYTEVGVGISVEWRLRFLRRIWMCWSAFTHSSVACISTLAELRAVIACRLDIQWMGPLSQMTKPDNDRVLNKSMSGSGDKDALGTLWSCGPQFALQRKVILGLLSGDCNGNLR